MSFLTKKFKMKKIKEILDKVLSILNIIKKILDIFTKKSKNQEIDKKKNEIFNNDINNCTDMSVCDTIRKEKQDKINSLKCIIIIGISLICGCIHIHPQETNEDVVIETIDVNQLTTEDKTYKIVDTQKVCVYDKNQQKEYMFNSNWFIVHSDILKNMNENQNLLLDILNKKDPNYIPIIIICLVLFIILGVLKLFKK